MRHAVPARLLMAGFALVMSLSACDAVSGRETAGEYVDDSAISTRIKSDLLSARVMQPHKQIHVETFKGHVTLGGQVDSRRIADKAMTIARKVPSVVDVKDEMEVRGEARQPASAAPAHAAPEPITDSGSSGYSSGSGGNSPYSKDSPGNAGSSSDYRAKPVVGQGP